MAANISSEEPTKFQAEESDYLKAVTRTHLTPVTAKSEEPQTSSQEIGWFSKYVATPTESRADPRVNHPKKKEELSGYMSKVWRYYPTSGPGAGSKSHSGGV